MKHVLTLASLFLTLALSAQQLPQRSYFTETSFIWNPAMTVSWDYMEFGAMYRQQWVTFKDAPRTATGYFQIPISDYNMGVGVLFNSDRVGPLTRTRMAYTYAYRFRLGIAEDDQLSIGIGGNFSGLRYDPSRSTVRQAGDPLMVTEGVVSGRNGNVSFGIFYATRSIDDYDENNSFFYAGLALQQMIPGRFRLETSADELFFQQSLHGNVTVGGRFARDEAFLEPSVWVDYSAPNLFLTTLNFRYEYYDTFWGGLSISSDFTGALQGGVILKEGFLQDGLLRIGGSGNFNFNKLNSFGGIGFEFFIAYRFWM